MKDQSSKLHHRCDPQSRAGMWVIFFMGTMGLISILGLLWLVGGAKVTAEVAVVAVLGGAVQGAMTGLPALLARMSSPEPPTVPQDVNVVNRDTDPVPVETKETK